jgi:hypothetical protein
LNLLDKEDMHIGEAEREFEEVYREENFKG